MVAGPVLMLWSAPRSRSTAFFRMMAERGDVTAVHEPFSYLAEFGHADIGGARVTSVAALIAALGSLARQGPVFAKETSGHRYPEVLTERQFLARDAQHTFLIRHPRETIASYHAVQPGAALGQIGFESLHEVFTEVARVTGRTPLVVDSADLVARPAATVRAYCERAGLDFRPGALTWAAADRPEWQPSRDWHTEVAASSGFTDTTGRHGTEVERHPVLSRYLAYHLPFYQELYQHRLLA
jgi:hypothetical protein